MTSRPGASARPAPPLAACAEGTLPPNLALARLIALSDRREAVRTSLLAAQRDFAAGSPEHRRLRAMLELWDETPSAWDVVRGVLGEAAHGAHLSERDWGKAFDRLARISPEAGVAIYSLGRQDILDCATRSILARLRAWGLLGATTRVLDLGCGCGRLVAALAPEVGAVVGADVSRGMLRAARQRCAHLANATLVATSGRDLAPFANGAFSLITAVDVFPYLVTAPDNLAPRLFGEARRVLDGGGALMILNYAYGRPDDEQQAEVSELAARFGFEAVRFAAGDFALWDGRTFHLKRAD